MVRFKDGNQTEWPFMHLGIATMATGDKECLWPLNFESA
jgi:hypothetical protein